MYIQIRQINKNVSPKTKLKLSLRSPGVKVEVILTGLKIEYSSMRKAVKSLGIHRYSISKIFDRDIFYKNKFYFYNYKLDLIEIY